MTKYIIAIFFALATLVAFAPVVSAQILRDNEESVQRSVYESGRAGLPSATSAHEPQTITVEELSCSVPEGYNRPYVEFWLNELQLEELTNLVGELADRDGVTDDLHVQIRLVYVGSGPADNPGRDNVRENFLKPLARQGIRRGANVAGDTIQYRTPYPYGYEAGQLARDAGEIGAQSLVNSRETRGWKVQVVVNGVSKPIGFRYNVTYYQNGQSSISLAGSQNRLSVIGFDNQEALRLAGSGGVTPVEPQSNLGQQWVFLSTATALVEAWR